MNLITCKKFKEMGSLELGVGGFGRAAAVAFCAVVAACAIRSANAAIAFETKNENRNTYTFGTPVESGETGMDNIGTESANPGRFTFRAGTVNIKEGGYVRVSSIGDTKDEKAYGNWIGNAGNPATLNISGGTFWAERVGDTTGSGFIRIGVSDKGSNTGTARINLSSGWLGADLLKCGGSTFNIASAKNTPAEMNMSGGKAVIDRFQIGASASGSYSSATFNMTGGEMEIGNYFEFCAYHNQSFNWGGGTIAAKKENIFKETSLQANCTRSVTLSGNPSVFDTGNFAQTIPVCIANATGDGTLKLTGGNRVTLTASPSYNLWLDDGTTLSISDLTIPADGSFTFSGKVTVDGALTLNSGAIIVCNVDAIPSSSVCALTVNDGFKLSDGRSVLDSVVISGAEAADYKKSISGNTIIVGKNDDPNYIWNGKGTNWSDADAWNNNGSTSVWYDNYNAIFNLADATATLGADVIANSLAFEQNATIDGSSYTLTVPTVSVAEGFAATISAPTAGALEKTGAGTLTLGSSRDDQTTLSEGTLAMSGGEMTLDWSKFTLGTDPAKPVTLRLENGAMPTSGEWRLGRANITSTVVKAEGDWSRGGYTIVIGNAEGADTTFIHEDGSLTCSGYLIVGGSGAANSTMILSGGSITNSNTATGSTAEPRTTIGYISDGTLIVTNGASLAVTGQHLGISDADGVKGIVEIYDGSTIDVANAVIFGQVFQQGWGEGKLNLHAGGTLATKTIRCSTKTPAEATAEVNFDGGTLKALSQMNIILAHDHLTVNVSEKGGTIDNNGKDISIEESFNGPGTINLIGSGMTTFAAGVGAEGGVSVANGTTLTINGTAQSSFGSLTLAARSTLALSGVTQSSLGAVTLEAGSSIDIATPATDVAAFAATTLNLPAEGTVTLTSGGGAFGEGLYAICEMSEMSGVTIEDVKAKFVPLIPAEIPAEKFEWSIREADNTLMLAVGDINPNTWTGGANNGNLSDPKNWLGCAVPESGTVTINTTGTLTVGGVFSPDVIVFPETCGAVTIAGENAITGIMAITNLSSSICTFEVPVAFADKIDVYQTARYDSNSSGDPVRVDGGHVRFAGGVTGTAFAEGTTHRLDGAYTIPATAGWVANAYYNVWTLPDATTAGGSSLTITGSSHDVPGTTDTSMLYMGSGNAFTTGVVRTSNRLSYRISGEYVVTNELEVALMSDISIAQRYNGTYKFEKLTLGDNGKNSNFWLANSTTKTGAKYVYIGAGGINVTGAELTALVCGSDSGDTTHLYPWHSDYVINGKGGSTRDLIIFRATNLYTDDENGVSRTVTLNGVADVRAALTVKGSGKLQVNSNGMNGEGSRIGSVTVADSATLAYASGADLGAGSVLVGSNATMEIASGEHNFNGLTLNDGATLSFNFTERAVAPEIALPEGKTPTVNGAVKVKIPADSKWPTAGEKVLTTCGGFNVEGVTVFLITEGAPKWAKRVYVNEDGNIVLDVKPRGTRMIVR